MTGWPWPLDGTQNWFEGLWDWIGTAAVDAIAPVSKWIWDGLEWLRDRLTDAGEWIVDRAGELISDAITAISGAIDTAFEAAGGAWGVITGTVSDIAGFIGDKLSDVGKWLHDTIWGWVDGSLRWLTDTFRWLRDEITETSSWIVDRVGESVVDLAAGGMEWVRAAIAGVAEALGDGFKAFYSWLLEGLEGMATTIAKSLVAVRAAIEGIFTPIAAGLMETLVATVSSSSPDKETVKQAQEFAQGYLKRLMELLKEETKSVPELKDLLPKVAGIIALNLGAAVGVEIAGLSLDQAHPVKNMGFRDIAVDLVASFQFPAVIGPMLAGPIWPAVLIPLRYRYNEMYPTGIPGTVELRDMAARGAVNVDEYTQAMKFHALDETWATRMLAAAYRTPGYPELQMMFWREAMSEAQVGEALQLQGVRPDYIPGYMALLERIPGPMDILRMAVREAFTREELDVEFPEVFGEWMVRQGYAEIWSRYWWRAHWVLVPLGQLYDLYHRGLIDMEALTEQLKYHDYTPEWRGLLIKLSWELPGRIDARWMFRWGIIDVDRLRDLLVARGLDPEWGDEVALATARQQWLPEINRLRDNLKRDYVRGYIVEEELVVGLEGLGYPPEWVEFHVRDAIEDGERELMDDMVDALGDGYLKDVVNDEELEVGLAAVIVRPDALQMELERLWIRKYQRPKAPTPEKVPVVPVSTLRRAFRDEIITEGAFEEELLARGYPSEDVDLIVAIEKKRLEEELVEMPEKIKTVAVGTLRAAFRADIITEARLEKELRARKYPPEDVELIIAMERAKKLPPVVPVIPEAILRRAFREAIISEAAFRGELAARDYSPEDIEVMVAVELKAIEKAAEEAPEKIPVVSVGTLRAAFRADIITESILVEELLARRYPPEDIAVIVELEKLRKVPPKVPLAPLATIRQAYRDEILSEAEFRRILEDRDYPPGDVDVMVAVEKRRLEEELAGMPEVVKVASVGTLRAAFRAGILSEVDLRSELLARGYRRDDVELIISLEKTKMEEPEE